MNSSFFVNRLLAHNPTRGRQLSLLEDTKHGLTFSSYIPHYTMLLPLYFIVLLSFSTVMR